MSPSGKAYIGQTINLKRRLRQHFNSNSSGCPYIRNAIKKYGSQVRVEIILEIDNNLLDMYETAFISAYRTLYPYGYNLKTGGGRQTILSQETRNKISTGVSSFKKKNGDWVGEKNPQYGRKFAHPNSIVALNLFNHLPKTEEHRQKLSNKAKDRFESPHFNPWRDKVLASRRPVVKLDANGFYIDSYESVSKAIQSGGPKNLPYYLKTGKSRDTFYWYYL